MPRPSLPLYVTCRLAALVASAILLCGASDAGGQKLPVTVRGTVMDSTLSRPLPGVILLLDSGERARADRNGRFVLQGIPPGRHRITVLGDGCRVSVAEFDAGVDPAETRSIVVAAAFGAPELDANAPTPPPDSPGRLVTGAEIRGMNAASLVEVIRRVAPYMVAGPGGQAGAGTRLMGRGGRTVADARVPLVIVDDVVLFSGDPALLDGIGLGDIAWLEILPGAVGGWSFGTKGSAGVIRIRTHQGGVRPSGGDPSSCLVAMAGRVAPPPPAASRL